MAVAITSVQGLVALVSAAIALICIGNAVFNVFFHPLRKFPGPPAGRAFHVYRNALFAAGRLPQALKVLHDRYGPVVRIAPNELSFISPQAWRDIYAPKAGTKGSADLPRYERFYRINGPGSPDSILTVSPADHAMLRRHLTPLFSDRALRVQEPVIRNYADLLVRRFGEISSNGERMINLVHWLSYFSFDIISKLMFDSDFGCLESSTYHPWVKAVTQYTREFAYVQVLMYMGLPRLVHLLANASYFKGRLLHEHLTRLKLEARLAEGAERPDLVDTFLKLEKPMDMDALLLNVTQFIVAGSETTATLMVAFFALLVDNNQAMERVTAEVRSRFRSDDDITLASMNDLTYLMACINETMRCFPPIPGGLPRVTPPGGAIISGHAVPQETVVSVCHWAAYHSEEHFVDAQAFHPERFLKDERFAGDRLEVLQPFIVGPRNCIGRTLAYAETRLALAKILFHFDVEFVPESRGWMGRQKAFVMWFRTPFYVLLKPVGERI